MKGTSLLDGGTPEGRGTPEVGAPLFDGGTPEGRGGHRAGAGPEETAVVGSL